MLFSGLAFSQYGNTSLQQALNNLQSDSQTFLIVTSMILFVLGFAICAIAVLVYFLKIKGKTRKGLWVAIAVISAIIGLLMLVSGFLCLIIDLVMPSIIQSLLSG